MSLDAVGEERLSSELCFIQKVLFDKPIIVECVADARTALITLTHHKREMALDVDIDKNVDIDDIDVDAGQGEAQGC